MSSSSDPLERRGKQMLYKTRACPVMSACTVVPTKKWDPLPLRTPGVVPRKADHLGLQ